MVVCAATFAFFTTNLIHISPSIPFSQCKFIMSSMDAATWLVQLLLIMTVVVEAAVNTGTKDPRCPADFDPLVQCPSSVTSVGGVGLDLSCRPNVLHGRCELPQMS